MLYLETVIFYAVLIYGCLVLLFYYYCSYGNGVIEYCREISARTEQYWCPIKHASRTPDPHQRMEQFADFGDAESYKKRLIKLRKSWAELENEGGV